MFIDFAIYQDFQCFTVNFLNPKGRAAIEGTPMEELGYFILASGILEMIGGAILTAKALREKAPKRRLWNTF